MLSSLGTHGPHVSPLSLLAINSLLFASAIWLLMRPNNNQKGWLWSLFVLAIIASASRILLGGIPNIMPVTIIVIMVASKYGVQRSIAFVILVTVSSNAVLGDGWWTLFQVLAWSGVACVSALFSVHDSKGNLSMKRLTFAAIWSAPLFSIIVSLSILDGTMSSLEFVLYLFNGIPFDALHMMGNVFFAVWSGAWFERILTLQTPSQQRIVREDQHVSLV
jgi:energy-coupling factor transport system substrate-specific component